MSNILSKLIELLIIDECSDFNLNDFQFGFVRGRGTSTAISLAHDVLNYCNYKNSAIFMCSLDVEGAFDSLPHPIIFNKAKGILNNRNWKLLVAWYEQINVQIKWKGIGNTIRICKGTRQGGLTSTLLFNICYKDMIDAISKESCGISISSERFNIFCYADDILLVSTTVSGLQSLIDVAVQHVSECGLRFNPQKTKCSIYMEKILFPSRLNYTLKIIN